MSDDDAAADGGMQAHTVKLELVDEPGELLRALQPIAEHGGNLISVLHERANRTPRGHVPVEIDLECPPERFDDVVTALRSSGVNVVQAGSERYGERLTVVLVGHLVDTDLSNTLTVIEDCDASSVVDVAVSAPQGTEAESSARVRLAVEAGRTDEALDVVREVAEGKDLDVIEPLVGGEEP